MEDQERGIWLEHAMDRWETSLLRLCFCYLQDSALAEDAVQETFLKAWKGYRGFRREGSEKTWLTRIAVNTCKDMQKSAWYRHTDRSTALDDLPEGSVPFEDGDDTVTRAVLALPDKQREAALLCWLHGMSSREAARALRIPHATVYYRLKQAKNTLQRELEDWYHAT